MARFSDDTIEKIRMIDIVEILPSSVNLKKKGKTHIGLCPFHEERTPSFSVDPDKGLYYCFGCEAGGNIITAYMSLNKCNFTDAVKNLANNYNIPIEYEQYPQGTGTSKKIAKQPKSKKIDIAFNQELKVDSGEYNLAISEVPAFLKKVLPKGTKSVTMTIYHYSEYQQIRRYEWEDKSKPKRRDKTFRPFYFNQGTKRWTMEKGDCEWQAYKINDVCKNSGKWVLGAEGEKCAESLISKGFYTLTWAGVAHDEDSIKNTLFSLNQCRIQGLIYFIDNDQPGANKAQKIKECGAKTDIEVIIIDIKDIWTDCPDNGDIADYLSLNPNLSSQDLMSIIITQAEKIAKNNRAVKEEFEVKPQKKTGEVDLHKQIEQIYSSEESNTRKLAKAHKELGLPTSSKAYFESFEHEAIIKTEQKHLISNFSDLANIRKQDIGLDRYLYGDNGKMSKAFKTICKGSSVPEINMFMTLLSAAAPFIGKKSKVWVSREKEWSEPCVFWTAIVGNSGSNKSFPGKLIFSVLQDMEDREYKQYMKDLAEYEKNTKDNPEQTFEKPIRKRFLTKDITVATLESVLSTCGGAIVYWRDELSALIITRNKSGNGGDVQYELQEWQGGSILVDRADKNRQICISKTAVSRAGTIQFEVLKDIAGDFRDTNGWFARWLFSAVESGESLLNIVDGKDESTGIKDMLRVLFSRLDKQLLNEDYDLSTGAKQSFQDWANILRTEGKKETLEGLKLAYPKLEAYTARLALWLHCVNATLAGKIPDSYISQETMDLAVELGKFFLGQVRFIHNAHSPESGIAAYAFRIYELIKLKPEGVEASAIKSLRFNKRYCDKNGNITTDDIRVICEGLVESGRVLKSGSGKGALYSINPNQNFDIFDKFDGNLTSMPKSSNTVTETITDNEKENFDILTHEATHSQGSKHQVKDEGDHPEIQVGDEMLYGRYAVEIKEVDERKGYLVEPLPNLFSVNGDFGKPRWAKKSELAVWTEEAANKMFALEQERLELIENNDYIKEADLIVYNGMIQPVIAKRGTLCIFEDDLGEAKQISENQLYKLTDEEAENFRQSEVKVDSYIWVNGKEFKVKAISLDKSKNKLSLIFHYPNPLRNRADSVNGIYVMSSQRT